MAALAKLVELLEVIWNFRRNLRDTTGKNRTVYDCIEFKSPLISSKDIISASLE